MQLQVDISGTTSPIRAILGSGSPTTLADQLTLLDQLARSRRDQISAVATVKTRYDGEKQQLDELIKLQAAQDADLAAKKKTIEIELDGLQKLRIQAYGTSTVGGSLRIGACPALYIGGRPARRCSTRARRSASRTTGVPAGPVRTTAPGSRSIVGQGRRDADALHGRTVARGHGGAGGPGSPGDLVFFYSDLHHVGMYVGNGIMVHSPHAGDVVRMSYVTKMPLAGYRRPAS